MQTQIINTIYDLSMHLTIDYVYIYIYITYKEKTP